jgi:signal peptidase II
MGMSMSESKPFTSLGLFAYVLAAGTVIIDQLSKWWVINVMHIHERGQIPVLPFFKLSDVGNIGVSYGLLRAQTDLQRDLLIAVAGVIVAALAWWVRRADRPLFAAALGFVIGGAIGNNLIDRPRLHQVVDFLDFGGLGFPWVFNVADSAITVGVVLLLIDSFFGPKDEKAPEKASEKAGDEAA